MLKLTIFLTLLCYFKLIFNTVASKSGIDKSFYIYPWPTELDDVYPPFNATLHRESSYHHSFRSNRGLGDILDPDIGLFQTWQFSLYKNIMQRLRVSPYRTYDPDKASIFIIPFDCGVHSYIDHLDGRKRFASPHGWTAKMLLENSPHMKRHGGHDHWVIFSITLYSMIGVATNVFYQSICYNCSTLVIETSPTFLKGFSDWPYKQYWYAVPYPSSFHWHENIKQLPWSLPSSTSSSIRLERNIFILFIGSVRTATVSANRFRKVLQGQCHDAESRFKDSTYDNHAQFTSLCSWHPVVHSCLGVVNSTQQMRLFTKSIFCPAPVGDSLTRKSLFDALVAGCIPVIFDELSLSQYTWHITLEELRQISVFIPKQNVINAGGESIGNFVDILRSIPQQSILAMQIAISKLAPRLQFSFVPEHVKEGPNEARWQPPFPDAVSVIEEHILDPTTVEPMDNSVMKEEVVRAKCLRKDGLGVVQDGVVFSRGLAWHRLRQLCSTVGVTIDLYDGAIIDLRNETMKREYEAYLKVAKKQRDMERKILRQKQRAKQGKVPNSVT